MSGATAHYLSDEIDPLFLAAARDALLAEVRGPRVLNVGIGYGVWCDALSELAASGQAAVVGLDCDAELVAHGRARHPAIDYRVGRAEDFTDPDGFDTIVASHLLEHLDEPVSVLRRWAGLLRRGGRLIVVVPNARSVHRQIGVAMSLLAAVTDLNDADRLIGHRRVYTAETLRADLGAGGFTVERCWSLTFKALSNAQLAAMPRAYVAACASLGADAVGDAGVQLAAIASVSP